MKPNSIKLPFILLGAALMSACSGMKMASDQFIEDDVYNSTAKAKEYYQEKPNKYAIDSSLYEEYLAELPYDPADVNYSNRINRFSYYNPWRAYYDGMYGYMPSHTIFDYSYNAWLSGREYGYFPYYGRYGFNLGVNQFNAWFNPYLFGSNYMFGSRFGHFGAFGLGFWGPHSLFDYYGHGGFYGGYYGGYLGGYFGGGYVGGINNDRYNSPNYGARPARGAENGIIYTPRGAAGLPNNNTVGRPNSTSGSRAERFQPQTGNMPSRGSNTPVSSARPSRGNENTGSSRPTMSSPPSRPSTTTSSSGGSSRGGASSGSSSSGSSSSGSSSSGGGRPTRGN